MTCRRIGLVGLAIFIGLNLPAAWCADNDVKLSQYVHTTWRSGDAFEGTPNALAQTKDGYLWIGTRTDLIRFDGVRFSRWSSLEPDHPIRENGVTSLTATADGSLWIAGSSLMRYKDGKATSYDSQIDGITLGMLEDPAGGIWVARILAHSKGPLCRVQEMQVKCFGKADGMPINDASSLYRDEQGMLWLGGVDEMVSGRPGAWKQYPLPVPKSFCCMTNVTSFEKREDGSILVGRSLHENKWGLEQFHNGVWTPFKRPGLDGSTLDVTAMRRFRDGSLWIGTKGEGLYVVHGQRVDHFGSSDGLSGEGVEDICEDQEGDGWVATAQGLDRFRIPKVISFTSREGLSNSGPHAVLAVRDGAVYLGSRDTLDVIREGSIKTMHLAALGLSGSDIRALLEDHAGRLWVQIDKTIAVLEGTRFRILTRNAASAVNDFVEDGSGDIWFTTGLPPRIFRIHNDSITEEHIASTTSTIFGVGIDAHSALVANYYNGLTVTYKNSAVKTLTPAGSDMLSSIRSLSDGHLIGISGHRYGFRGYQDGKLYPLGLQNGLPCESVYSFLNDDHGTLWLYAQCGLIAIEKTELDKWWKDPKAKLMTHLYDGTDGARPAWPEAIPPAALGRDGKLWFSNHNFVQMFDTKNIRTNTLPPPVHIETVHADRKEYPIQPSLRLPKLTRDLEIDYTALSLTIPQKVQFRYRLEGRDKDWQEAGSRRQVFYTDLPPATYHFQVIAANNDGVWNTTGDTLSFVILPAFYQTLWFKVVIGFFAAGVLWMFYILRLRSATAEVSARLGERLQERERIARDLHDTMLQDFQAVILRFQVVANRLMKGDPRRAEVEEGLEYADKVLAEGREHIRDLRADTKVLEGLVEALAVYGQELSHLWQLKFAITTTGEPFQLDPVARDEMYRIGREAIGNAFRHSNGSEVTVEVSYTAEIFIMRIRDDGKGIETDILKEGRPGHWGIRNMRERAENIGASLNISSLPGSGSCVELKIAVELANGSRNSWFKLKRRRVSERRSTPTRS